MSHVTSQSFLQRIVPLLMDARGLPRKPADFHIVLISALCGLDLEAAYSEKALNGVLERWVLEVAPHLGTDHVALRRYLVDAGFLTRDAAGRAYRVSPSGRQCSFDPEILALDVPAALASAKEDRLERKRRHQANSPDA